MNWYTKITNDLAVIPDFIEFYQAELGVAKAEIAIRGNLERNLASLPGITEHRFNQLQEIEAVLNYLNIRLRKIRSGVFRKYLEGYNRALSSRDAEKYSEGESDVIDMETLINEVSLLRNRWLGIMKALESKNFMLGHITKLKCAGMEDFVVG